ncbi:hypothetical protein IM697_43810 [Streptomyces ferrugineus]|uniref:Uncharacterized protein n=1 Tax=Streptomyces ferrugineus TaxID=1413221 RepID=A0A7M2SKC9_9ACTN|nr:hypothetical protein [Streptomyces ferrugineus]QOV36806.1 hypothetical protein IM697_43810 [Streptomyces ferrugineus]
MGVTWQEKYAADGLPGRSLQAADQTAAESVTHCSDLLDDFLKTISRMEREYLRAAMEGENF